MDFEFARRSAVNNELIRLIWASYKEGYFIADDNVSFHFENAEMGSRTQVNSWQDAQSLLYDAAVKGDIRIVGRFGDHEALLHSTPDFFNALLPYLKRAFPHVEFSQNRWENWLKVSEEAVYNEALAILDKRELDERLNKHGGVFQYALTLTPNESFAFMSRYAAYCGRFDIPFSKMKLPIGKPEALTHAPEFGQEVRIILAAIRNDCAVINAEGKFNPKNVIQQDSPEEFRLWEQMLSAKGLDSQDYTILPIHPLSLELYREKLENLIKTSGLVIDESVILGTKASLSYRTMIPNKAQSRFVYKLPVPLQLTGYIRYIDPEELAFGPQLSRVLCNIFQREANFGGRLQLDQEVATIHVKPDPDKPETESDSPYLSCLIRENQSRDVSAGSATLPLAALFSASCVVNSKPVLIEVMERAGARSVDQATEYFRNYTSRILKSVLSLYLRHGIMLEAHQQNMGITINQQGQIEPLHYHDIADAIMVYQPIYSAAGHHDETIQQLENWSDDITPSSRNFIHCNLILNLFPAADLVAKHINVPHSKLIQIIAEEIKVVIDEERSARRENPIFQKFFDDFEARVLKTPHFEVKRMLGRLFKQSQVPSWGQVPNKDPAFSRIKEIGVKIDNPLYSLA